MVGKRVAPDAPEGEGIDYGEPDVDVPSICRCDYAARPFAAAPQPRLRRRAAPSAATTTPDRLSRATTQRWFFVRRERRGSTVRAAEQECPALGVLAGGQRLMHAAGAKRSGSGCAITRSSRRGSFVGV